MRKSREQLELTKIVPKIESRKIQKEFGNECDPTLREWGSLIRKLSSKWGRISHEVGQTLQDSTFSKSTSRGCRTREATVREARNISLKSRYQPVPSASCFIDAWSLAFQRRGVKANSFAEFYLNFARIHRI